MAALGTLMLGQVMGHTEAEKAFRPWWDKMSDYILYGMTMLGVILLPTAMFSAAPMDCNRCIKPSDCMAGVQGHYPPNVSEWKYIVDGKQEESGYNNWWVKKYCLMNEVDWFILHFPYILFSTTMLLFAIEKTFVKLQQGNLVLNKFYALMVDYNIIHAKKDVDIIGCEKLVQGDELESRRDLVELRERLNGCSKYFYGYLATQVLECSCGMLLLALMTYKALTAKGVSLDMDASIYCDVHDYWYECSGHPSSFYTVVNIAACILVLIFVTITFYSILWVLCPCLHVFTKLEIFSADNDESEMEGTSRDFRLLLNLLVMGAGLAPAITTISILDLKVHEAIKPRDAKIKAFLPESSTKSNTVTLSVELEDPDSGIQANLRSISKVSYTAEIVKAVEDMDMVDGSCGSNPVHPVSLSNDTAVALMNPQGSVRTATFEGLHRDVKYSITIKILVNGMAVANVMETFVTHRDNISTVKPIEKVVIEEQVAMRPDITEIQRVSLKMKSQAKEKVEHKSMDKIEETESEKVEMEEAETEEAEISEEMLVMESESKV